MGGDEFVVLLEDIKELQDALTVAGRIREEVKAPFNLDGHEVVTTVSIGVVFGVTTGGPCLPVYDRPGDVVRDADIALYRAKELGKDRFVVFDTSLRTHAIARLELESELRVALERGELSLHYQPIRSLVSGRISGFEALLRWNSPTRGSVSPAEFIPVAEETGLIVPIGEWVLRQACRQTAAWQAQFPSDPPLAININISGVQFRSPTLYDQVQAVLEETGLEPACVGLEITESVLIDNSDHGNSDHIIGLLRRLRELGVRLQIDDFGTGYSSLAYLQRYPISTIKIDRSFVARLGSQDVTGLDGAALSPALAGASESLNADGTTGLFGVPGAVPGKNGRAGHPTAGPNGASPASGSEIVKTIVALAHDLGLEAVAEGVETQEQLEQLKALDCPYGQGYFIARPMPAEAATALLVEAAI
jgi:EAL domain-containing protein (putative c-di-GMP-specific phosphodiesterase class I)